MKVQLSLKAKNLENVAGAFKGKSDPYAVVTLISSRGNSRPEVLGQTEAIKNTLNPDWSKSFSIDYELGYSITIVVKVFDEVRKGKDISMGSAVFELGALIGAKGSSKAVRMKTGGTLYARIVKNEGVGTLRLKASCKDLKFSKKVDPFYQVSVLDGENWDVVHRSAKVKNSLNPGWNEEEIPLASLGGKNFDTPLKIGIWDFEKDGKHEFMVDFETSVNGLVKAQNEGGFNLINKQASMVGRFNVDKAELSGVQNNNDINSRMAAMSVGTAPPAYAPQPTAPSASLQTMASRAYFPQQTATYSPQPTAPSAYAPQPTAPSAYVPHPTAPSVYAPSGVPMATAVPTPGMYAPAPPKPTFVDYLNGGCEIQLSIAIDFTGSNGDPRVPGTLHHLDPYSGQKNDYEKAISAIGGVLANYDTDKNFPVWGFGAKFNGQLYNLFQCGATAEAHGIPGVLKAYHDVFKTGLVMSGPTVITQVIDAAAAFARKGQEEAKRVGRSKYSILLILTDGSVSDVNATLASLQAASTAPLSVVVVGIGQTDFSAMKFLDDHNSGNPDITQFVEFNAHRHSAASLTQATLHEIPHQLVSYFTRNGIMPQAQQQVAEEEIVVETQEQEIDFTFTQGPNGQMSVASGAYVPHAAY